MSYDFPTIASGVDATIQALNLPVTITRATADAVDPAAGTITPGVDLVATGYGMMSNYSNRDIDGTLVKRGDMKLLVGPGLAFDPAQNDTVTVDSVTWNVVWVEQVNPAGTVCLFKCQVRK